MADEQNTEAVEVEVDEVPGLVGFIKSKFVDAETGRLSDERRWLSAYKNYRGIYDTSSTYRSSEKSKVFVRITKVKVLAAFGQISDILFANNNFPITVSSTPIPEGIAEFAHLATPEEKQVMEQARDVPLDKLDDFLGGLKEKYVNADNLVEGPSVIPGSPQGYGKRALLEEGSITLFNDKDTIVAGTKLRKTDDMVSRPEGKANS